MQLRLEEAGAGEARLAGTQVDFAVQMPDRLRVTARVPREAHTWSKSRLFRWDQAGGNAGVAWIQKSEGSVRHYL